MNVRFPVALGVMLALGSMCAVARPSISHFGNVATTAGHETILYSFKAGNDGGDPLGALIADSSGALYGTTAFGGGSGCLFQAGCGTVFKLSPAKVGYHETILYRFQGGTDGDGPAAGLVADNSGALYGTTEYGGGSANGGTVFKLTPSGSTYTETVLHVFTGGADGYAPLSSLLLGQNGVLYGTTLLGGTGSCGGGMGCGTVFSITPNGSEYTERIVYRFKGGKDGATPAAPLMSDSSGTLYGAAATGGIAHCGGAPINDGCGTIFTLTPNRSNFAFRVLHRFHGAPHDGANPFGSLVSYGGTIFGTTEYGGKRNVGSVFMMIPGSFGFGTLRYFESVIQNFHGTGDGEYPLAGLVVDSNETLYGVTQYGGSAHSSGTAFQLVQSAGAFTFSVLHHFTGGNGGDDSGYPTATLLLLNGALYGTAPEGGNAPAWAGTAYRLQPS
ncbi:MAG: hypothetical protein JO060_10995 [Candidatus Eremiobacteraeota bacterium]|nr:hypothetical protein [Candidatus Eremiobacteraeota bacterium]